MVIGHKSKNRRSSTVNVEYLFRIHEIKPWPPSQSLRNLRSVLIQWEHGERHSGVTNAVVPSLSDGRIEFSESFRVSTTLQRDMSVKSGEIDTFLKNCLEFNLYEPRRDKIVKGQMLATAVLDLAEYGVIKEGVNISIPMKCTRSFRNTQPSLFISIHAVEKGGSSSSGDILAKQASMERKNGESVSALMNDEYAEEAETASSFTDDDVSSQSSLATSSIPFDTNSLPVYSKNGSQIGKDAVKSALSFTELSESFQNGHGSLSVDYEDKGEDLSTTNGGVYEKDITEGDDDLDFSEEPVDEISRDEHEEPSNGDSTTEMKSHVKSVRSSLDIGRSNGSVRNNKFTDAKYSLSNDRKDVKTYLKEARNGPSNGKIQHMESRIKMLEGELKEAAVLEVSLYSVVAEHGSSMNKVHAPARRLSRYYFHACKESSPSVGGSAAKSAVSGLVVVAKACGNDVSRLTFWLSNSIVLRAIVTHALIEKRSPLSIQRSGCEIGNHKKLSPRKKKEPFPSNEIRTSLITESFEDWDDPRTFISALEKIESWIFSRIIESIWWQTLTPHMQPAAVKVANTIPVSDKKKTFGRNSKSGDEQQQINFSLELWKKAFKDACDRLCPLRAGGHECGCLPVLGKLIMEQCIARLDVAMFNAILRESDDELPTDPISDPITDTTVLPIPSGKASFGAGAQLKNGIGNWSRWLSNLFGIDEDEEQLKDQYSDDEDEKDASLKPFHLLNALSDLMMLPKDMLLSRSIRKEVCPTFGAPLIKRVLSNFVPDEFCPDPIPEVVFEALDNEDPEDEEEIGEDSITNFPCSASPIMYLPPSSSSIGGIIGITGRSKSMLLRSGSSLMRKSYTSDDELDELHSPLNVIIDSPRSSPSPSPLHGKSGWEMRQENGSSGYTRYELLREVWTLGK
ncbi:uncharacterized protein LOC124917895 isoform X2 [Impatiens glandulifera]|uniref:uncharacterized protein LOC124917895 isoform X2 n=1 Tax=Impatiens glandulifera TaxID=253017 RepID=UPI001FB0AD0E|nr:uncharacterized protein LOC124917895 isoform X2 [Impatiens glandulifera]